MQKEKNTPARPKKKSRVRKYIFRAALLIVTLIVMAAVALLTGVAAVAYGPSKTVRNSLVLSATQASATKWVPGLFLSDEEIADILDLGSEVNQEVISFDDYKNTYTDRDRPAGDNGEDGTESGADATRDEWADAKNGMKLITFYADRFRAYVLLVKDPSRLYVATTSSFSDSEAAGKNVIGVAAQEGCIAAINGGEFPDSGGLGKGGVPVGVTYSKGELVWNQSTAKTFIGFDKNDKLVVRDDITAATAEKLGIRDGVCFQPTSYENVLITNDGNEITIHRHDGDRARAQRTAIGQRADGTVILLVTDGRSASSPGATYNDVTEIMVEYGAVTAGMLDGGSSSVLYYENYHELYPDDFKYDELDRYQQKGMVNKYVAFSAPRAIPTFFCVAPER